MDERRELNDEERNIYLKQIERLQDYLQEMRYKEGYHKLMVEQGLKVNYLKQLAEHRRELKQSAAQYLHTQQKLAMMRDHLERGVPKKENIQAEEPEESD